MRTVKYLIVKNGRVDVTTSYKEATSEGVTLIDTVFEERVNAEALSKAEKRAMGLIK